MPTPCPFCRIPRVLPLGYRKVAREGGILVEPDPALGPLVAEAFTMLSRRDGSLRSVLPILTAKGLRGRGGRPLTVSSLHYVVGNPAYCGFDFSGRGKETGLPALVSPVLFAEVQERLRKRWH